MSVFDLAAGLRSVQEQRLRAVLTATSVAVGVAAIVTLTAILAGVQRELTDQLQGLGANLILVVPGHLNEDGQPNPMALIGISPFSEADVTAVQHVAGVEAASPVVFVAGAAQSDTGRSSDALVVGTNRAGVEMNPTRLRSGRYFTTAEAHAHVCVLAEHPAKRLFPSGSALGRSVRVGGRRWTVVGVLGRTSAEGTLGNSLLGLAELIYLPEAAARRAFPAGQVNRIVIRTGYSRPADTMIAAIRTALIRRHGGKEDFGLITQRDGLKLVVRITDIARTLLIFIAGLSVVVAALGVANVMLLAVVERTREIGIRKTVGARRANIFAQFLAEALGLSFVGGAVGLAAAVAVLWGVRRYSLLHPLLNPGLVVLAIATCCGVGLAAGVVPAVRASGLQPVDALRHE